MTDAERIDKLMDTNGKLCAEINRQERRIRRLEALVRDMWGTLGADCPPCAVCDIAKEDGRCEYAKRMAELGIEVDDGQA